MPLNEAQGLRHSSLTEKEQREAMRALYGLEEGPMSPVNPMDDLSDLSVQQRVRLRQMLDDLDRKQATNSVYDLNKPPVPPYVYREFPYLMYNHHSRTTKAARNNEERERMMAEGWSREPYPAEVVDIEEPLTEEERAEAAELDRKMKRKKS